SLARDRPRADRRRIRALPRAPTGVERTPRDEEGPMIRAALALLFCMASVAAAQPARPPLLVGIGVDQHLGDRIPLDLPFTEAVGRRVRLGDYFDGTRPVLMVLAYVRCKMLCSLVLHEATDAVRSMKLELGRDYRVVTVSIDPDE